MIKKKPIDIEKIYVCKTLQEHSEIIEKVLIQYVDGNSTYFGLPSFYYKMKSNKQEKERKLLEKYLDFYIRELSSQDGSSLNYLENSKVIVVNSNNEELKKYVDEQIEKMDSKEFSQYEIGLMISAMFGFSANAFILSALASPLLSNYCILLNTVISCKNFKKAIDYNKKRILTEKESQILKNLKLYFSRLMIALNIGLNIANLSVNYDKIQNDITLIKKNILEVDNPFTIEEFDSLVTTSDAAVNLVMEGLEKNPLLNEEDLEIALSIRKSIEDNPFFDYEKLYETFYTVSVMHYKDADKGDAMASYDTNHNNISMYQLSFSSEKQYEDSLLHEIYHSLGSLDNRLLNEGMTTLLQIEYCNDAIVNCAYYDHVLMTKIFCELITPDKMLEAYTKKDMSILKEEMLNIDSDEENYNALMEAMQSYSENFQEVHYNLVHNLTVESPANQFYTLLMPYLKSDKINDDTKIHIMYYLVNLGYWNDVPDKFYFNKNIDTVTKK